LAGTRGIRDNSDMFEIGGSLREARLKRGLTPADVQKAIRIRDRYLQALEEERWELLPGDAYVKGFLRTYADFLGLDGSLYVDEYNNRFAHPDEQPQLVPERFARRSGRRVGGGGRFRPALAVAVLVAIVAAVAAWRLSGSSGNKQGAPPTTSVRTTTGSHHTAHKKKHKQHHSAPLPTRATLVASRGASWLWVRKGSASGPTVYEGTLLQGKTLPVDLASGPVWIRIGDPTALDVRLGGAVVHGLPTQVGNVILTRRGLKTA
jgi:Helix-turn-helix domain/RodZ C-terminal domain